MEQLLLPGFLPGFFFFFPVGTQPCASCLYVKEADRISDPVDILWQLTVLPYQSPEQVNGGE